MKCNFNYYKYFIKKSDDRPMTDRQLELMRNMSAKRKSNFIGYRNWLDANDASNLNNIASIHSQKFTSQSQKGWSMNKVARQANDQAESLAEQIRNVNGDTTDPGMMLLMNRVRGDVFNTAEKELVTRTFLNRFNNLDLLTKQIDNAVATGNTNAVEALSIEMNKTIGAIAAYMGDINATSAAFRHIKRMNQQIKQGREISKLFENGGC
jgi:hypothetical protein